MPRAATPTHIKIKTGNPGKRKINKREPQPIGHAKKPSIMTPAAAKVWARLVAAMPVEVYTDADSHLLAAYCEAVANHQHATAAIAESGFQIFAKGSTGQDVLNPLYAHQEKQARLIVTIGQRLGLDPIARQQINSDSGDKQDEFAGPVN